MILHGIGASEGIGIGKAVCIREQNLDYSSVKYGGRDAEKERLKKASKKFSEKTSRMAEHIKKQVGQKESEILTGQIMMLSDPFMTEQINDAIDSGLCAEAAVDQVCGMYAQMFAGVDNEMMRQRAADVKDIKNRMLSILLGVSEVDISELPVGTVLIAKELTPSMTVGLKKENVAGIITETGGITSHSAILARAMEVPAVLSVHGASEQIKDGDSLITDGKEGTVFVNPDERTLGEYIKKQELFLKEKSLLAIYKNKPTVDAEGSIFNLYANIGSAEEAKAAAASGAEGIGLFRTEFLYMDRTGVPSETEQYEVYKAVSDAMPEKEIIIRTLDVGGDKAVSYLGMEKEENPFLGHRAIRYCLDRPELFKIQLRALLRAAAEHENIKIMLPLVTSVEEIRQARALLEKCKGELKKEGVPYFDGIKLGIMVETPAAALTADILAGESDFFSIGTNDLTQYTMAVDRGNPKVEKLYTVFSPAVLRSIRSIITAAKEARIPVGMCGEAAADPKLIPLLMTWGLDEFSVSSSRVLATRAEIHKWRKAEALKVTKEAMSLSTATGIEGYLESAVKSR